MIFPFTKNVSLQRAYDPARQIDCEVGDRTRRLFAGMALDADFCRIVGALVVTEARGKYLKVIRAITYQEDLPDVVTEILQHLATADEIAPADLLAVASDISMTQQAIFTKLKNDAGKYLDRLLVIALLDPGIGCVSDPQAGMLSICNPVKLADATGVSVVDGFIERDIVAGGNGNGLCSLPAWFLLGDRTRKIAELNRVLIVVDEQIDIYYLPASDGFDEELPQIQFKAVAGLAALRVFTGIDDARKLAESNLNGKFDATLASRIDLNDARQIQLKDESQADLVRTVVVEIVSHVAQQIKFMSGQMEVSEIYFDGPTDLRATFLNQLSRHFGDIPVVGDLPCQGGPGHIKAILAALLGAISVDQMPANIPWITGASQAKILGRFSPGSPSNWRQLLKEMSDVQPPAMRLRDAI